VGLGEGCISGRVKHTCSYVHAKSWNIRYSLCQMRSPRRQHCQTHSFCAMWCMVRRKENQRDHMLDPWIAFFLDDEYRHRVDNAVVELIGEPAALSPILALPSTLARSPSFPNRQMSQVNRQPRMALTHCNSSSSGNNVRIHSGGSIGCTKYPLINVVLDMATNNSTSPILVTEIAGDRSVVISSAVGDRRGRPVAVAVMPPETAKPPVPCRPAVTPGALP
jgi:hypothetical protein